MGQNITTIQGNLYPKNVFNSKNKLFNSNPINNPKDKTADSTSIRDIKKTLFSVSKNNSSIKSETMSNKVINNTKSVSEQLRASRNSAKDAALKVKKLKYNFKSISSKLLRSKTSYSAKQVAGEARREVQKLKRQGRKEDIDKEELQFAIEHAKAMERVAKKKARHLLEEEMLKASGGPCMGNIEENEDDMEELENDVADEDMEATEADIETEDFEELTDGEFMTEMSEDLEYYSIEDSLSEALDTMLSDMFEELSEDLKDMFEEMGLGDLFEDMSMSPDKDIDPADFKMMKIKHRNSEMKDIVKADSKYLKDMFEKMAREGASPGGTAPVGGASFGGAVSPVSNTSVAPEFSINISI